MAAGGTMHAMVRRAKPPGLLARYVPHLEYLLIDEHRYDLAELARMKNLVAAAIRFERPERAAALVEWIDVLNQWLEGQPELQRIFALWIRAMVLRHHPNRLGLPKVRDLRELKMTLTDRFDPFRPPRSGGGPERPTPLLYHFFIGFIKI